MGQTALMLAAEKGHKDIVLALIEKGAYLDAKICKIYIEIAKEKGL